MEYNFFTEKNKKETELAAIKSLAKWNFTWKEDIEKIWDILKEIFDTGKSSIIKDSDLGIFLSTLLYLDDEKTVEKALRNLYYVVKTENNDENINLLFSYCRNAFDEKRELVRGRKHWIALSIMQKNNFSDDDIETYVKKLKGSEESAWVWERIFGTLATWNSSFRIYPEIKSWNLPEGAMGNNFSIFARNTKYRYNNAVEIHHGILNRTATWIQLVIDKKMDYSELGWVFRFAGNSNGDFPLAVNMFKSIYTRKDEFSRIILLHYLSRFLEKGLWKKVTPYIDIIKNTKPLKDNLYEEMSLLLIRIFTFMEKKSTESSFNAILEFLETSLPEKYNRPEIYYELSSSFTPLLLRLITDKTEQTIDTNKIGIFLKHQSAYYQLLSATLLLHLVRNGYDISSNINALKNYLKNNPETKNTLVSGNDIEQDEFEFRYIFGTVTGFVDTSKEGEDGFFNLGGLTGLLEICQPPTVSYRVALALREYGERKSDSELLRFLASFSSKNEALKDLKPVFSSYMSKGKEAETIEILPSKTPILELEADVEIVVPIPPAGPMKLPELVELFNSAITGKLDLKTIAANKQEEIRKLYERVNTNKQHNLIKQTFGDSVSKTNLDYGGTGHFASIFHRTKEVDNEKLEYCKNAPDSSIDYLACYLPADRYEHRYGIYFFAERCAHSINKNNLNTSLFIRTIAVHELFHAHMDLMLDYKGKYHSHKGEKTPYCRLEEAAANFMANKWLSEQKESEKDKKAISDVLFKTIDTGGRLGYGEYDLMDNEAPEFLPGMIIDQKCHVLPPTYSGEKIMMDWGFNIKRQKARQIWGALIRDIEEEVVPYYFDWEKK